MIAAIFRLLFLFYISVNLSISQLVKTYNLDEKVKGFELSPSHVEL